MKQADRIEKFSDASGPGGSEDAVVVYAQKGVRETCACKEDHMCNLYMNSKGNSQSGVNIMLDAHSDEVGFIVRAVKSNRPLRSPPLGGWDMKNIVVNKVLIRNGDGRLTPGIVCSKPIRFVNVSKQGRALDFADILIDVGATSTQEIQESFRTGIGTSTVPDVAYTYDEEHQTFMGRVFDNRIGCAAVAETPCRPHRRTLMNIISATLSSQEEVGKCGMTCVMDNVKLDVAIRFKGCPADDSFGKECMIQGASKKGPMPRHFNRSMITSPRFQRFALELAHANDIPVQESARKEGGTSGGITHAAQFGTPIIVIGASIHCAYSSYGTLVYQDYEHVVGLAVQIVEGLSRGTAESS